MEYLTDILIAGLAFLGTLIGSITSNQKTLWRIQELEKKQDRHNSIMERVAVLEVDRKNVWRELEEIKKEGRA